MKMRHIALAAALASAAVSPAVLAADAAKDKAAMPPAPMSEDARMKKWNEGKDQLEKALATGKDKAFYRQTLERLGYAITAVNADKPDYLEYEVIKGGESYEVQVDFSNGVSTTVDIATNLWRAAATKAALGNKDYTYAYPTAITDNADRVSERTRAREWADEKKKLEQELGIGHERSHYGAALEKMGYQVTAVNERDVGTLELEVVKGDTSYEVEVDFDERTKKSTRVDVSTNLWETEATERAKGKM